MFADAASIHGRNVKELKSGKLKIDEAKVAQDEKLDGKYQLFTSDQHPSAADIALGYKQLLSLAGRTIFQVDQAASTDQSVFQYLRKRRQNSDLDRYLCIRVSRYIEERLRIEHSLYTIFQLLSLTLFEKVPLQQLVTMTIRRINNDCQYIKLKLFEN